MSRHYKKAKLGAGLWLAVVIALLAYNAYLWLALGVTPNTNIMALLPAKERDPLLQQAFVQMVDSAEQRIVVLIGGGSWLKAKQAANAYQEVMQTRPDLLTITKTAASEQSGLAFFKDHRFGLLTPAQHRALNTQNATYWVNSALGRLYNPFAGATLTTWQEDPFGLYQGWLASRGQESPVRPRDGLLFVGDATHAYAVVLMKLRDSAFSMQTQTALLPLLKRAQAAAGSHVNIIRGGVVLHAAAAAEAATHEMATIGAGSLAGIVLLMLCTFASTRPLLLIALSLAVGSLAATAACYRVFGQIHLLTFVFGTSLIGIAQDYAIYFMCSRLSVSATLDSYQLVRRLMPGLVLTLLAALIGYLALALTPFPGLRQMAVFSGVGLIAAWLTVICWFPLLVKPTSLRVTRLGHWLSFVRVPQWHLKRGQQCGLFLLAFVMIAVGLARLTVSDDIRSLQKTPAVLWQDQLQLTHWLDVPAPAQFYVVRGASPESVLQREEQLKVALDPLVARGIISGYQAMSNWVPSLKQQQANQQLISQKLMNNHGPLAEVARQLGENNAWLKALQAGAENPGFSVAQFLATPMSNAVQALWLKPFHHSHASIVALRGISSNATLTQLQNIHSPGVQWVDKVASISALLGHYRHTMTGVIIAAYGVIGSLLFLRYRARAWRVLAPPGLASVITLALLGWFGWPLQLFHVLALLLILGLGVDYGIFLNEQVDQRFARLTVGLSALSALLAFGLLALSQTPPLHAFGITMALGLLIVWLLAPLLNTYWQAANQNRILSCE